MKNTDRKKLKIPYPIIVEGKYDKAALLSVADALIIKTDGFGVFKSSEIKSVMKALALKSRIIILTDSDKAGGLIRSHIKSIIPKDRLISLYIPQIKGKEKRKTIASAEGTLGVEGMSEDILYDILKPYEKSDFSEDLQNPLSKTDFFNDGLCGGEGSSEKRDKLASLFALPNGMNANALLEALKIICTYEEYKEAVKKIL